MIVLYRSQKLCCDSVKFGQASATPDGMDAGSNGDCGPFDQSLVVEWFGPI
jgi:hypothetical protein